MNKKNNEKTLKKIQNFKLSFISLIVGALVILSMLSACQTNNPNPNPTPEYTSGTSLLESDVATTQELKKFQNIDDLKKFLIERSLSSQTGNSEINSFGAGTVRGTVAFDTMMVKSGESLSAPVAAQSGANDFSQTNVQVKGVDEGDFVKNDGTYIYMIADNKLIIVDAYDAKNAKIISTTQISSENNVEVYNSPRGVELFVNGNKLVLFVEANEKAFYFEKYDIKPLPTYKQKTYVQIYDITDKENPMLTEQFSISGSYYQSRMIGDIIYAVTTEGVYGGTYINEPIIMDTPMIADSNGKLVQEGVTKIINPEIYYFDNPDDNYQFNTISSINLKDDSLVDSKTYMLGYTNTLMVSENNIYIAYQKQNYWRPFWRWGPTSNYDKDRFYQVVLPLLSADLKTDIDAIIAKDLTEDEKWKQISDRLSKFYEGAKDEQDFENKYQESFDKIQKALDEYDKNKAMENAKTIIHKIGIDNGKIEYKTKGEVYGTLLNQFSLDEYNGYLRLATNLNVWVGDSIINNNVYILDSDMNTVGTLKNLAEGERIYSTRFLGDKLYMVTFKQVDPLFVIELSDPQNPKVLGYLKIPGYSDYLHPYDATHIIGIGKETSENQYGGVVTQGLKIAFFDVTDFTNPMLVDKVIIGDKGSDSPALHDHKAFLFSDTKKIMVLPVTEVTQIDKIDQYRYNMKIWNGAYVFNVSETGFTRLGKVQHSSSTSQWFNWWTEASVLRSLYMDDNLYTISNKYIKINDLSNNLEELNTVKLPYDEQMPYYQWGRI